MTPLIVAAVIAGLLFAAGIMLAYTYFDARKFQLDTRLAPYLVDADERGRFLGSRRVSSPLGVWGKAIEPLADALDSLLEIFSSPSSQLQARLRRAGRSTTIHEYRLEQIQWAVLGLLCAVVLSFLLAGSRNVSVVPLVILVIGAPFAGLIACDYRLKNQITSRAQDILTEFPTVAELLALSVAAGEGPLAALERVSNLGRGALAEEIAASVSEIRSGTTLTQALENLGQRTDLAAITRFADGVALAVERGTPLAKVLRAQAQDARELGHRELMETGGKKEITMLFPVIFLILPITIVFAVFPSLQVLRIGF
jgi:tight adherence protein C